MSTRGQTLVLIFLLLFSLTVTQFDKGNQLQQGIEKKETATAVNPTPSSFSFERASLLPSVAAFGGPPQRKWSVLDPEINSEAVLIQSLTYNFPLFHFNVSKNWPMASLSKLLTAVLILEDVGENKKIPVSRNAVLTEGEAGNLRGGEIYTARDLLKIMLLTSSNDAAAAFEEYLGGKEEFVRLSNRKAETVGMTKTIMHDASGLSDLNESSAEDMLKLTTYIIENHPQLWGWTRLENLLVQPINAPRSHTVYNINPLVSSSDFLGGKTGTSPEAGENLSALFTFHDQKLAVILLGSRDRLKETRELLDWLEEAYEF